MVQLMITFFMIGFISFGGGYAMLPVMEAEALKHEWMSTTEFADLISVAGMAPGPIATNAAILTGYHVDGIGGAVTAGISVMTPSALLILAGASFFRRHQDAPLMRAVFYGLRPIVAALILFAAMRFAGVPDSFSWEIVSSLFLFAGALFMLIRKKWNPVAVLALAGLIGIALYS